MTWMTENLHRHFETLNSPVTPSKRGSKRKMEEDAVLDEPQCWIETILKDLPNNDDSEDLTYEPTNSETDSEEYKSQNDTEGDLEYEEKEGLVMLKEDPISLPTKSETDTEEHKLQNDTEGDLKYEEKDGLVMLKKDPISLQGQNGEGPAAETAQTADARGELVASQTSGDDDKLSEHCLLTSSGTCSQKSLESTEIMATSIQGCDPVDNNDFCLDRSQVPE